MPARISEAVNLYAVALRTRQPALVRRREPQDHQRGGGEQISVARVSQGLESRLGMNFNRRQFLGAMPAALAAARVLQADPLGMPIGCQTYPVRAALAKDFEGTLRESPLSASRRSRCVRRTSYADFRPLASHKPADRYGNTIEAAGLRCESCHYGFREFKENLDERIAFAKELGLEADGAGQFRTAGRRQRWPTGSSAAGNSTRSASGHRRPGSNWVFTITTASSRKSTAC